MSLESVRALPRRARAGHRGPRGDDQHRDGRAGRRGARRHAGGDRQDALARLDGEPILLVMSGEARLDNRKYKDRFGAKAKMLDAEEVLAATSHPVGGVCPIGLPRPLRVYADVSLRRFEVVVPAAGDTHHAMRIAPERLVRARGGRVGRRGAGADRRSRVVAGRGVSSPTPGRAASAAAGGGRAGPDCAGCRAFARSCSTSGPGCATTSSPGWC